MTGAVGGHVGIRARTASPWSFTLAAGNLWAAGSPKAIHAQTLRVFAGADYDLLREVRFGLGVDGRMMLADQGGSQASNAATAGALATLRYVLRFGALSVSAGPAVELLAQPLVVQIAGAEVFRVPSGVASLIVDANADLGR